jgi:O-antigen/teichoic acid export membrane protein
MLFTILISPFWSAFSEAWIKKELVWIKSVMQKLIKIWGLMLFAVIFLLIISPWIYQLWIGKKVNVPFAISALMGLWVILNIWNGIFSNFLNGVGKIKLQLYFSISTAILNIPLAFIMGKQLGISGVLFANVLTVSSVAWIGPMQYNKIIKMRATGIWNK